MMLPVDAALPLYGVVKQRVLDSFERQYLTQRAFNVAREASYVATVRNPKAPAARGAIAVGALGIGGVQWT